MRKKFIYIVLIPLVILLIIVYLFHNAWIESGIEYAAEEVVGAKVEIDDLKLDFSPLGIEWNKMQVTNPYNTWKNWFETGKVKFSIDFGQLLRGKYIINEMEVNDVMLGTKRKTDGAIEKERNKRALLAGDTVTFAKLADKAFKNIVSIPPVFDLVKLKKGFNADSLVKALDLKTVEHIDTLKSQVTDLTSQWANIKNDFESQKQKVIDTEKKVAAINPSALNNVQNITSAITTVNGAVETINGIKDNIDTRGTDVKNKFNKLSVSVASVDDLVKSDFDKLKNMAHLPSINTGGIANILVGSEMYKRANNYLHYADYARENVKKYQPETETTEKEEPPRMKGQDIKFPEERGYPKLWIKKIKITGRTEKTAAEYFHASGIIENVTDNQRITGSPITISLVGTGNNSRTLKLDAILDRRKDIPVDQYTVSMLNVPVSNFSLGNSNFLPSDITQAVMNSSFKVTIPGRNIDATADFNLSSVKLQFKAKPKNTVEEIVQSILTGINDFNVQLRMWNTKGAFDVALSTDLDEKLTQRIKAIMGEELTKLQNELRKKLNNVIQNEIQKYDQIYKAKLNEFQDQLGGYQSLIADKLNIVDNKKQDLLAQLEKQKKNLIGDKLKNLLK